MKIEIFSEKEITPELDQNIRDGLCISFPQYADHFRITRGWHGVFSEFSLVGFSDEDRHQVSAHAGVVERDILINGFGEIAVFGIQNVFIHPNFRRQGLLDQLMAEILKTTGKGGYDCGLLFCIPELEKVYSRFSWKKINNGCKFVAVDNDGAEQPISMGNIAMFYPHRLRDFPEGDVNLQGFDW